MSEHSDNIVSKAIDLIRFPMIVGIVVIHANYMNLDIYTPSATPLATGVMSFFSEVVARCCVPLFFVISGYLFFRNVAVFTSGIYLRKIKSRVRSILQPYVIWNLIGFLFLLFKMLPCMHAVFPGVADMRLTFRDFLSCFWSFRYADTGDAVMAEAFIPGYPIDYPLWFLRDLMVIVLLTPVVYLLLRYVGRLYIAALGVMFVGGLSFGVVKMDGLFFFSAGAALSMSGKDLLPVIGRMVWTVYVYPVVAVGDLLTRDAVWNHYVHSVQILLGVAAFVYVAVRLAPRVGTVSRFMVSGAFFVYLSHTIISRILMKILAGAIHPASSGSWIVCYLLAVVLLVLIQLGIYRLLCRYTKWLAGVLVGGR